MTETLFTKTEARRRLTAGRKALDKFVPTIGRRVEIGSRTISVHATGEAPSSWYAEDEDLDSFGSMDDAAGWPDVRRPGYVAHYYLSTTGPWGELEDVCCVWLGDVDHEPVVLDVNGARVTPRRGLFNPA